MGVRPIHGLPQVADPPTEAVPVFRGKGRVSRSSSQPQVCSVAFRSKTGPDFVLLRFLLFAV
jgi:hypothetical protein